MPNQILIANLYNPHEQSKQELIDSFVVRLKIFHKLFSEIRNSDMKHPEQHFLIEAQRGMGKTTLLLRLSYEIENDAELNTWLIPVVFKEESYYGITRLFKLWEETARLLESREPEFAGLFNQMEAQYDENKDYERLCFEILTNALKQHHKKLILFIDNLSELFKNFNDMECHRLREILMNCPEMRIIGATAGTLEASFRYEHAFYEFFKRAPLPGLDKEETYSLLRELAKTYQKTTVMDNIIAHQPGRIESLRILTGGVIRTMVLLFEIFTDHENGNSVSDLEKILDRVTPLYKHRMDDLAPMQREVVQVMALSWDAVGPEEIAQKTRMSSDKVAEILAELEKLAIIQRTATDTQMNFYYLQERFFNIWYLMRLAPKGSRSHSRVIWLVRFLESWYDEAGLVERARKHIEVMLKGEYYPKAALYLTEALSGTRKLDMELEHELICQTRKFLEEKDIDLVSELSQSDKELFEISRECFDDKKYEECLNLLLKLKSSETAYRNFGLVYERLKQHSEAEKYYLMAIEKGDEQAMFELGSLYQFQLKDNSKSEKYYLMAIEKGSANAMFNLGALYANELKDYGKSEKYLTMALEKESIYAMNGLGNLFERVFKNHTKAEKYYLMAVEKGNVDAMNNLGLLYKKEFKDNIKAEKYYLMAVEKGNVDAMNNLGLLYEKEFKNYAEAEKYYLMAAEKGYADAIYNLGQLYRIKFKDYDKAEKYYLMAIEKGHKKAMSELFKLCIFKFKDYSKLEKYLLIAVEKGNSGAMMALSLLYVFKFKDYSKAEKYLLKAMKQEGKNDAIMMGLGFLYYELNDFTKADEYFSRVETFKTKNIKPTDIINMFYLFIALLYLYIDEIENVIQIGKEFIYKYKDEKNSEIQESITEYIALLLAKEQYHYVTEYFEDPELNLKDRFKPLYYALLHFKNDPDYHKMPPELAEPVKDIIEKVKQMAVDYA